MSDIPEQGFRSLVENAAVAVATSDLKGRFAYVNQALADLLGYSVQDLVGRPFKEFLHSDDRGRITRLFLRIILLRRQPRNFEFRVLRKDGRILHLMSKPTRFIVNGKTVGFQAIIVDITERKEVEKCLADSNRKLEMLFETATEGMTIVDAMENLTFVNKAFADMLGYREDELVGMNLRGLVDEKVFNDISRQTEYRKKGTLSRYEIIMHRKDGKPRRVQVSASPLWNENGAFAGSLGIVIDITERKKAEDALRKSEKKSRTLLENLPQKIFFKDKSSVFISCNENYARDLEIHPDEITGKTDYNFYPKKLAEKYRADDKRIIKSGKTEEIEEDYIQDGQKVFVHTVKTPVTDEKGNVVGILGIFWDITDRKRAEEELIRLSSAVKTSTDSIVIGDLDAKIIAVNEATLKMYGTDKKADLIGKNSFDLIAHEEREKALAGMKEVLEKGYLRGQEYHIITKDGARIPVEMNTAVMKDADGKPIGFVSISRDIIERKNAEKALLESQQKFERLFKNNPDASVYVDANDQFVDANSRFVELFGYSPEEARGKALDDLIVPENKRKEAKELTENSKEGYIYHETERKKKNGSIIPVSMSAAPIYVDHRFSGCVVSYRDITERVQMQKKLQEYSQQLEEMVKKRTRQLQEAQEQLVKNERLAAVGQVAAMVGHDLRNPLTGIFGATYYLKKKLGSRIDKTWEEMLTLIEENVKYSNKIISDLLEYSGEMKLELVKTTPKLVIKEALSLVRIPANIQVLDLIKDEQSVRLDGQKMKRVFINIIKNAVEAMPNGGTLKITSAVKDGNLQIFFSDTGLGIFKDVLEKVWTPFFTTKAKGMGLGLSICKRIVEAHKGNIALESTVGKGTILTITFPLELKIKEEGGEKVWTSKPEFLLSTTTKA